MTHKQEGLPRRPVEKVILARESFPARDQLRRLAHSFRGTRNSVARLFDRGMSAEDIAQTLSLSVGTVEEQLRKIQRKRKRAAKIVRP